MDVPIDSCSPPTAEDITTKIDTIRSCIKIVFKSNIARKLHVSPRYLADWMAGVREIPPEMYNKLCELEIYAIRKAKWEEEQRNQLEDIDLADVTKQYLDKQVRMQEFRMGETILQNLAENPKTIAELRKIVKKHRQSVFRKVQDMEFYGVIECVRVRHHALCHLKPGVKQYLDNHHWIDK